MCLNNYCINYIWMCKTLSTTTWKHTSVIAVHKTLNATKMQMRAYVNRSLRGSKGIIKSTNGIHVCCDNPACQRFGVRINIHLTENIRHDGLRCSKSHRLHIYTMTCYCCSFWLFARNCGYIIIIAWGQSQYSFYNGIRRVHKNRFHSFQSIPAWFKI